MVKLRLVTGRENLSEGGNLIKDKVSRIDPGKADVTAGIVGDVWGRNYLPKSPRNKGEHLIEHNLGKLQMAIGPQAT